MDASLAELVEKHCQDALVIAPQRASRATCSGELGVPTEPGTDTAWTFEPAPPERAEKLLRARRLGRRAAGAWRSARSTPSGGRSSPSRSRRRCNGFERRLLGRALQVDLLPRRRAGGGPALERVPARRWPARSRTSPATRQRSSRSWSAWSSSTAAPARALSDDALGGDPPLIVSDEHDMYEMVAVLRRCSMIVSSRYHALVCSMPGLVPSIGVTMDERIRNLMADRGQPELALEVDDPELRREALRADGARRSASARRWPRASGAAWSPTSSAWA